MLPNFGACNASGLVSIPLTVVTSTDFASDDDELSAVCDSKISSRRQIAEFDGEIRFVDFSCRGTCGDLIFDSRCGTGGYVPATIVSTWGGGEAKACGLCSFEEGEDDEVCSCVKGVARGEGLSTLEIDCSVK